MNHVEAIKFSKDKIHEQLVALRHPLFWIFVILGTSFVALYQFFFHRIGQVFDNGGKVSDYLIAVIQSVLHGVTAAYFTLFWVLPVLAGEAISLYFAAREKHIGIPVRASTSSVIKGWIAGGLAFIPYAAIGFSLVYARGLLEMSHE